MARRWGWGMLGIGLWMAGCRWVPGLAALWRGGAVRLLQGLHRMTAAAPFPVLEPLALGVICLGLGRRGPRRLAWALAAVFGMYAILWYPLYWAAPADMLPEPDPQRVEALCGELIDRLNGSALSFPPLEDPGVKYARCPEWMAAMGISGLFSPWTGEVILDPRGADGLMYFTAVHEQTHLAGIADEGEANIAAWEVCMARGGAWADSARLWALRYALAMLGRTDEPAAHRVTGRMSPALAARFAELSSADTSPNPVARLLGIARQTTDYDDLVRWVISAESGKVKKGC